jgi:septum formation protein
MVQEKKIVLASCSPRRRELLKTIGVEYECVSPKVEEMPLLENKGKEVVSFNALAKAKCVRKDGCVSIGADTAVYLDGSGFGKPKDDREAVEFLKRLSGKTHKVYTGVAVVCDNNEMVCVVETDVTFRDIKDEEIYHYVKSGSPKDKAGAYGIQDFGAVFVREIKGDYFNVVGLPISTLHDMLVKCGVIKYN